MTVADYPDWQTPQAHADQIASTGVPLLRNITVLSTTAVVNAGTTSGVFPQVYGQFYEGYLLEVIPQNPGTRIFAADLVITHLDASNNPVAIEQVTVSNWQNVGADTSIIRGRLLGVSLKVQAQVAASGWLNTVTGGASGGLLLATSSAVPLGAVSGVATFVGVLPDYTGPVIVSSSTASGGGFSYIPRIISYSVSNGTGALSGQDFPAVTNTAPLITSFSLPSCFNLASIIQHSTVAGNAGFAVTIASADQ